MLGVASEPMTLVSPVAIGEGTYALDHARLDRALYGSAKRLLDILIAATLLLALLPVFAVIGIAVCCDSGWPFFYRGERVGLFGRRFMVLKFRSMRAGADQTPHVEFIRTLMHESAPRCELYKVNNDPRVTRFGAFLRRTSLDELPQLWNVLRGDMSLVGPRPDVTYAVADYSPDLQRRLLVKPGMTGLWQVSGRSRLSLQEMYRLDLDYVASASLALDVRILARTVPAVLRHEGAA
jgi:lipopolysaccharide/colanic/teichoic acid biosynthesis glycosyltransferase